MAGWWKENGGRGRRGRRGRPRAVVSDEIRAAVTDHVACHPPSLNKADIQHFSITKNPFPDNLYTD